MTLPLILGADSAFPPTREDIFIAYSAGVRWWGFYLNGKDGDEDPLNTWTPAQVENLRLGKINPIPIWVPDPNLTSDPTEAAIEAYGSAILSGCRPTISVEYDGNHLTTTGKVTGPVWIPIPGNAPPDVGSMSAIQYGTATFGSTQVDLSVASADWSPNGLVVDFEFNTVQNIDWYIAWQNEVHKLSQPAPTTKSVALPQVAYPIKQIAVNSRPNGMIDIWWLGNDSRTYHKFWNLINWVGWEIVDGII